MPGDQVLDYLSIDDRGYTTQFNPHSHRISYERVARNRGLDLPPFYFSISNASFVDTLDEILPFEDRRAVKSWIQQSGNISGSLELHAWLKNLLLLSCSHIGHATSDYQTCMFLHRSLQTQQLHDLVLQTNSFRDSLTGDSMRLINSKPIVDEMAERLHALIENKTSYRAFSFPTFRWHGVENQYHQWMSGLIQQKPLTSLVDGRDAWSKIYDAIKWTLVLNGLALLIALIAGTWIGIWSGKHDGSSKEKNINYFLFALFAIPSFWLGTLFIYFLSSGEWLRIFPAGGLGDYHDADSLFSRWGIILYHLFLPVMCLALGALAYVSRQMKQSVLHEYKQPYVASLRHMGISEKTILRKHVVRNAMFPIITIIGASIPALLSGSLIIEVIFGIPGMGRLMFNSLMSRDWPVAFPILMTGGFVTVVSYILTDIIYFWADPRVKTLES